MTVDREAGNAKVSATWAKRADKYDKSIGFFEQKVFGTDHRAWACSRAAGKTLEVAVGTGLNLPLYGPEVSLTGIDLSPEMLEIARDRAAELGVDVVLQQGDAHELAFEDAAFDTVVCTYALCGIPDPQRAVNEMNRVLRPDGRLILVDHIVSAHKVVVGVQKTIEFVTRRLEGEHMTRRPLHHVEAAGFEVIERDRLGRFEMVERLVAVKS